MEREIQDLIEGYERGITVFSDAVNAVPESILDKAPALGKWTVRQIVLHMADVEIVAASRFRWFAAEPGAHITAWDQDIWAEMLSYSKQPIQEALQAFIFVRKYTAQMFRNLPDSAWQNTARHEEQGEVRMIDFMRYQVEHAKKHAAQIDAIRLKFAA